MSISRKNLFCGAVAFLAFYSAVAEDGVTWTNAGACPDIADHQHLLEEILTGNYAYELPADCVTLPPGTAVRGPLERTKARYGDGEAHFVLVEMPDGRRLWTLDSWVKFDSEQSDPTGILNPEAATQLHRAYDTLRGLESDGRAMEHLRGAADREKLVLCGQQMRGHEDRLKALENELGEIPAPYGPHLRRAAADLNSCVSCLEDALERCDLAAEVLDRIEVALGPSPGSNDHPLRAGFG